MQRPRKYRKYEKGNKGIHIRKIEIRESEGVNQIAKKEITREFKIAKGDGEEGVVELRGQSQTGNHAKGAKKR
jgi:hypothetical protein